MKGNINKTNAKSIEHYTEGGNTSVHIEGLLY